MLISSTMVGKCAEDASLIAPSVSYRICVSIIKSRGQTRRLRRIKRIKHLITVKGEAMKKTFPSMPLRGLIVFLSTWALGFWLATGEGRSSGAGAWQSPVSPIPSTADSLATAPASIIVSWPILGGVAVLLVLLILGIGIAWSRRGPSARQ